MPFVSSRRPSLQLGLLQGIGKQHGFVVDTFHLNLEFAAHVGIGAYEQLCQHRGRMLGDWLFSLEAFAADAPDPNARFLDDFAREVRPVAERAQLTIEALAALRSTGVGEFLDAVTAKHDFARYDVVGFTSTFQQTVASVALARRIRRAHPQVKFLFGGANFDGDMGVELVRALPIIDYAISGEADTSFPALLAALEDGAEPFSIPGVIGRKAGELVRVPASAPLENLDALPVPQYDEFFERAEALSLLARSGRRDVTIPFESSRGCWWGAKKHCTFCGLNGSSIGYRSKSAAKVREELHTLTRRYRTFSFEAVDNIMDRGYLKTLLPDLVKSESAYRFFYEIKSNVSREDLRLMRLAGVRAVQPGIESLSSPVLRLMRKGVTASQNVNLLRWARYYGLQVSWNVLWGFPDERHEYYAAQAALFQQLVHLEPPTGAGPVWLERFSPLFNERDKFKAAHVAPEASYAYVYPREIDLERIAYFFDFRLENTIENDYFGGIAGHTERWQKLWEAETKPRLEFFRSGDFIQIDDRRAPDRPITHSFEGAVTELYVAMSERPRKIDAARKDLNLPFEVSELQAVLDELCRRGLMMEDEGAYLSLALPASSAHGEHHELHA